MKVILVSLPGTGKSTTTQLVKREMPGVNVINFGDRMFEIASKRYGIKERSELSDVLNWNQNKELQIRVAKEIGRIEGNVLVDTHSAVITPSGYIPGLTYEVLVELKPDIIVFMEFDERTILKRRQIDRRLKRAIGSKKQAEEIETESEITMHQEISKTFCCIAAHTARTMIKIINLRWPEREEFDHVAYAAQEIVELFRSELD